MEDINKIEEMKSNVLKAITELVREDSESLHILIEKIGPIILNYAYINRFCPGCLLIRWMTHGRGAFDCRDHHQIFPDPE